MSKESYLDFKEALHDSIVKCEAAFDISSFNIKLDKSDLQKASYDLADAIMSFPDIFFINEIQLYLRKGYLTRIEFTYSYDRLECKRMYSDVSEIVDEILDGIENSSFSDAEKALLIHDRIIVRTSFDYDESLSGDTEDMCFNIYGTLVERVAVCTGYSTTYQYLLARAGIKSELCYSEAMYHMWNIVYIDGKKYHVDTTWDDPVYDLPGRVTHDYFLISTNELINRDHYEVDIYDIPIIDFDDTPVSTDYDSYFWKNSTSEFILLDGAIYYIDNSNMTIYKLGDKWSKNKILTVDDRWNASKTTFWKGNYTRLSTDGDDLYYTTPHTINRINLANNKSTVVFTNRENTDLFYNIIAFTIQDNYFCYVINPNVYLESSSKDNYRYFKYREPKIIKHKITFDGNEYELEEGKSVTLELDIKYFVLEGLGYRFSNWKGNTELITDIDGYSVTVKIGKYDAELSPEYYIVGDLNNDGNINSIDSFEMLRTILGVIPEKPQADINNDGDINAIDSALLIQMNLGIYVPVS